jgi:hypothetical protein
MSVLRRANIVYIEKPLLRTISWARLVPAVYPNSPYKLRILQEAGVVYMYNLVCPGYYKIKKKMNDKCELDGFEKQII